MRDESDPYELLFDHLAEHGYAWKPANNMTAPTQCWHPDEEKIDPRGKIDWFFVRGLNALVAKTTPAVDAAGRTLSDRELLVVTIAPEGSPMKFASYNIHYGLGQDGHFDIERIAAAVADADIIALQEVERFWPRSSMVDQPAEIASLLPDFHWIYGANLDMDASENDADGRPIHRRRQFGNMILSRLPIVSSRNHLLPKFGATNQHVMQRGALETVIDLPDIGPARVCSTHLCHLSAGTRLPQVDHLLELHRKAPAEGGAWSGTHPNPQSGWTDGEMPPMPADALLMGDFNFEPVDPEYEKFVGPWSEGHGRITPLAGFVDSWVAAGNDEHDGMTCDDIRIDYLFASSSLAAHIRRAWIDTDARGSDHQPYWCELR